MDAVATQPENVVTSGRQIPVTPALRVLELFSVEQAAIGISGLAPRLGHRPR